MLLIDCPVCGPRAEVEFRCGGTAHIVRPPQPDQVSDDAWAAYLFHRENPRGLHHERWCHIHGCREWFHIARDTQTHEIHAVYGMQERAPELAKLANKGEAS